jgi:hypothetical protein
MNNNNSIIILGTEHELQCGTKEYSELEIQEFKTLITEICIQKKVMCIVEEMSDEGLSNHEVKKTVVSEVAKSLPIKYRYTDLTPEHLADLCIYIDQYYLREPTNELKFSKRELLHKNLSDPIRERYWLANILYLNSWPTLLICGSAHVKSMKDLIISMEYGLMFTTIAY